MSVRKCLECKYYTKADGARLGSCVLNNHKMFPNDTCSDFTDRNTVNNNTEAMLALEERVARLERLVMRLL